LETTTPNFLFADDAPIKKQVTEVFFQWLRISPHELCVSPLVEQELARTAEPKRQQLRAALAVLPMISLSITAEAEALAEALVREGAIPRRFEDDALHLAIAICHRVDIVVSWNMRHLVNPRRVALVNKISGKHGYPAIRVETPSAVMGL
jgi:predicted nucleic acid-binding protein